MGGPQNTASLANNFHLLLQDYLTAVASQDHEVSDRSFSSVQIFIEAASFMREELANDSQKVGRVRRIHTQIISFQDQKNDPWNLAQKLNQLYFISNHIRHLKKPTEKLPPATCPLPWHQIFAPFPGPI